MKIKTLVLSIFLTIFGACNQNPHKIASISEASGISYCKDSKTLFVVGDEGDLYEILEDGKILRQKHLGDFDLEGVVCKKDSLFLAQENGKILKVDRKTFRIKELKIGGKEFKFSKKNGIEGIASLDDKKFILAIQSKKKKNAKFLIIKIKNDRAKIEKILNSQIIDSAGLDFKDNILFVVSDKKDKLYTFDLTSKRILKKFKLPKFAQEGVALDGNGNIFFADDDGGVFKYKTKEILSK
jgi:uncharacterized protein YjiK